MSKRVHCAIYTRKSTEEGLEQDFNSLDAQREACEAYVQAVHLVDDDQIDLPLPDVGVVVSPFGFSETQGEGGPGQVWEPVCRLFHWTSVAKRAVV